MSSSLPPSSLHVSLICLSAYSHLFSVMCFVVLNLFVTSINVLSVGYIESVTDLRIFAEFVQLSQSRVKFCGLMCAWIFYLVL